MFAQSLNLYWFKFMYGGVIQLDDQRPAGSFFKVDDRSAYGPSERGFRKVTGPFTSTNQDIPLLDWSAAYCDIAVLTYGTYDSRGARQCPCR